MTITPNPLLPSGAASVVSGLLNRMRNSTCVIQRQPAGEDAGGAPISGDYATVDTVLCKVRAPGRMPVESISGGRFGPAADYEILLPPYTDVRNSDRIAVNGKTMEVIDDRDAVSHGFELSVLVRTST